MESYKTDKIEQLLEKYFEADTTAFEEADLRAYFSQDTVAEHLEQYAPMFQYFSKEKEERFTKEVLKPKTGTSRRIWYSWVSIAAIVLLLVGAYFKTSMASSTLEDEYTQEEIAAAQEALSLLSINFNKGAGQIVYLEEFEKNTNRFLDN
ncbi:hypothetical protein SAMN05421636_106289 [Pricia antarctica]|uniref:Uncharacterized protein n=1 Tax=Pricia antarctica TaxID=641691 RepID=A0A1G7ER72_9FLAO|nr:hypothetical protein [Pricia antarctica]SDE66162.1 hypothetical protein SAMN05421636_106289 [Pricia antarctica]